jgi:serine/threonine-protein kinase
LLSERYRILRLLGEGSSGRVYAAEHVLLKKKLALKILHRELTNVPSLEARFEREALASAHLEHPNIAAALDFGKLDDGSLFLALEYVEGRLLRDELGRGPLDMSRALRIARQVASALVRAQELGIVHRDLKPENVMLLHKDEETDFVKVLDFGIARVPMSGALAAAQPITRVGAVFGTPEYMAPEQALGQAADGRADLYALGVILFEMIAGVRPYDARDSAGILAQQISAPPPLFAARAPGLQVPAPIEQLVQRLLQREVSARFQRATEVLAVLDTLLARASIPAPALAPRSVPAPRLATFLPGDPLPAFELPADGAPAPPVLDPPDAPTMLRLPSSAPPAAPVKGHAAPLAPATSGARPSHEPRAAAGGAARGPSLLEKLAPLELSVRARSRRAVRTALSITENTRARLPAAVRERLRGVPTSVLLAGATLVALTLFIGSLAWVVSAGKGRSAVAPLGSAAASVAPPSSAIEASPLPTATPSVTVAEPKDADSQIAVASSRSSSGEHAEAVQLVARALTQHPSLRDDPRVGPVLFRGASADSKETVELAFGLLQGTMAARGADIVYQLTLDKSVRESVRKRAEKWLRSEEFANHASGALQSAVKLRYAESCAQKHELLPLASKVGARQTLEVLRGLENKTGCGLSGHDDCYPCLRKDNALEDAIRRVDERVTN